MAKEEEKTKADDAVPKEKREKLKTYDLTANQMTNSMGESAIATVSLSVLWEVIANGNKATKYFSELCSDDLGRQQVAVSRLCEVLGHLSTTLEKPQYKKYIQKDLYEGAIKELKDLKPHLPILQCKDSVNPEGDDDTMTVGKLNYRMNATIAERRDEGKVKAAAEALYKWLSQDKSKLRQIIALLSAGGLFYVAQCHEKTHRAYLQEKRPSKEKFVEMNTERLCTGVKTTKMTRNDDMPDA